MLLRVISVDPYPAAVQFYSVVYLYDKALETETYMKSMKFYSFIWSNTMCDIKHILNTAIVLSDYLCYNNRAVVRVLTGRAWIRKLQ